MYHPITDSHNPQRALARWRQSLSVFASGAIASVSTGAFLSLGVWLWAPKSAWSHDGPTTVNEAEVLEYGDEQSVVEEVEKSRGHQVARNYSNELDHAISVLLAKAYPEPKVEDLVRRTIDALCQQVESVTLSKIPDAQRAVWVNAASGTNSFETVLNELDALTDRALTRKELVDTGLPAMLAASRSKVAGVLGISQAERLANLSQGRDTPGKEPGMLGVDASSWPTINVVPGAPAAAAGLRDGDVVLRVNSREAPELSTTADALRVLRGAAGSEVSLTIARAHETLTFHIRRASAADRIKSTILDRGIVLVRIPQFEGFGISERVRELVHQDVTDATPAVILDVRDNSGGRPEEANGVADIFLDEKYLQIFQFRDGKRVAFRSRPGSLEVPVVLLTNQYTASCSEMLAIALHDNHRATVIGRTSAGALCGKEFEKLADGRMIIFRSEPTVLSPSGKDYSETGIQPDIIVGNSRETSQDAILASAIEFICTHLQEDTSQSSVP
jgi:C-terminal peptidase prc